MWYCLKNVHGVYNRNCAFITSVFQGFHSFKAVFDRSAIVPKPINLQNAVCTSNAPLKPPANIASPCDGSEVAASEARLSLRRAVDQVLVLPSKMSTVCTIPLPVVDCVSILCQLCATTLVFRLQLTIGTAREYRQSLRWQRSR